MVCPIVSSRLARLPPTRMVFAHKLCVFALDSLSAFAVLQSSCHDVWASLHLDTER